ncbi:hypothetical protein NHQ30_009116 [Ciborinia camelliae]|nr:hypothetical protein NHQ30_009116 [Ciborinia camelliae]
MTFPILTELVQLLTKPPSVSVPYQIPSGTVALFTASDWVSTRTDILLNDYVPNKRHIVPSSQYDQTTYVLYNLPAGTVMTLLEAIADSEGGKIADLSNCHTCLDLVGTGKTESANLMECGLNDQISMFFWRTVDLNMGAIELFDADNFTGRCSTIFLSEWAPGKIHSIGKWQLQDTISSVRWRTLGDRQTASLFDSTDGAGASYSNIKGWGSTKEVERLSEVLLNDCVSAFMWDSVNPVKEIIEPFVVTASNSSDGFGLTSAVDGVNNSTEVQPVSVSLSNTTAQTITVETSDQYVMGISSTLSQTATAGMEGIASASTKWSVSIHYDYTHTETQSTSETQTVQLAVTQTINAPAKTRYKATLLVTIGKLPATEYHTTAQRWYKDPVTGSQADPANNGWYKRVEDVRLSLVGSLACKTNVDMQATPL